MDLYRFMSDEDLDTAIRDLQTALATGASQIATPNEGSVQYRSRGDAEKTMKDLQRSWHRRRGLAFDGGNRIRYTEIINRRTGW